VYVRAIKNALLANMLAHFCLLTLVFLSVSSSLLTWNKRYEIAIKFFKWNSFSFSNDGATVLCNPKSQSRPHKKPPRDTFLPNFEIFSIFLIQRVLVIILTNNTLLRRPFTEHDSRSLVHSFRYFPMIDLTTKWIWIK